MSADLLGYRYELCGRETDIDVEQERWLRRNPEVQERSGVELKITHGSAKGERPDLVQARRESLLVMEPADNALQLVLVGAAETDEFKRRTDSHLGTPPKRSGR